MIDKKILDKYIGRYTGVCTMSNDATAKVNVSFSISIEDIENYETERDIVDLIEEVNNELIYEIVSVEYFRNEDV